MQTQLALETPLREPVPPLEPGDRLSREEFHRRYAAMPQVKKAELIEGVVYMPSPVSTKRHAHPHFRLVGWLCNYELHTPGVEGGDNASLLLDLANEPQPDAFLRILPEFGGQTGTDKKGYVVGGPELVGEVTATTASYDLHDKMQVYLRHGVREYIVWRVAQGEIDWFVQGPSGYERLAPNARKLYQSKVFPGLWLDPGALVAGNRSHVLEVAERGLASKEHAAFVRRLQRAR
jgi:Uma2 family endonuclease